MRRSTKKKPELIYKEGKPVSVIINIDQYEKMLEKLEDMEDLMELQEMRKKPLKFKTLEEYLEERARKKSA
jgi:PHD/YefM family antitoxin component YafN of YafNO toxin-antitoxin module